MLNVKQARRCHLSRGESVRAIHPVADDTATPIGAKLRSARTAQGMSLAQIAETTGLSKGFLSRVERDETSPSVATLVQLCQVLSLPVGALFTAPDVQHVAFADAPRINLGGVHADERLMSPRGEQRVQLLRSELEPDAHGGSEVYTINCEVEVLHVISGAVSVRFADRSVTVNAGDALTFPGREPHTWQVEGGRPAVVVWVLVPAPWSGSA
jgi:transcriptional regulator with XRE-family HTH domain